MAQGATYTEVLKRLEEVEQGAAETAGQFPTDLEAYMSLPLGQRLQLAAKMVAAYPDYATVNKPIPDRSDAVMQVGLTYQKPYQENGYTYRHELIIVRVRGHNPRLGIASPWEELGLLDVDTIGNRSIDPPPIDSEAGDTLDEGYDGWSASDTQLIAYVDEVAGNLIACPIARNRLLGTLAIQGVSE